MKTKSKQKNKKIPDGWKYTQVEHLLDYEQPTNYIVDSTVYEDNFKIPVLTAGKSFILGYTNEENNIFPKSKLPVIIFDDFTTANKFVDFEFKVKSSAMKILKNKDANISNINFVFSAIQLLHFDTGVQHKRNYLSEYQYLDIKLPPLPEQNRIVAVLETLDEVIEKLKRKIEIKKSIKKGLMQQLLTGKKRLPGFSGEWEVKRLGTLVDGGLITLGRGDVISKVDIAQNPGDNPIYSSSVHKDALFGKYKYFMFNEELITWSVDGGGHFFHRPKHKFSVTNVSGYMRVDTSVLNYKFLASQLQLLHSKKYFDYQIKAHPSVIRQEYIISYPSLKEQKAIAKILTTADEEIEELLRKQKLLEEQKRYLLNNLVSGEIRTPEDMVIR